MHRHKLPRIVLIDDQCGSNVDDLANICHLFGLVERSGKGRDGKDVVNPVAEVEVTSGQVRDGDRVVNSLELCEQVVREGWPEWALVLLDLRFVSGRVRGPGRLPAGEPGDDRFGLKVLARLSETFPDLPVIILSGLQRDMVIEEVLHHQAADFIDRNLSDAEPTPEAGRALLRDRLFKHGLLEDSRGLIAGRSIALRKALRDARQAAAGRTTLVLGQSGTGKELLARYLHDMSARCEGPYVTHDLQSPESLQESVLFGIESGAATDVAAKPGLFERANRGTLFLDEIAELDPKLQAKLLRVLESQRVTRVGAERELTLDLHVILATNQDLSRHVREDQFRADLLSRINAFPIHLPPLRERLDDLPILAQSLIDRLCQEHGSRPRQLTSAALEKLQSHSWPMNVRELRNVLDRTIRGYPDVEHVVPGQLRLTAHSDGQPAQRGLDEVAPTGARVEEFRSTYLEQLIGASPGNQLDLKATLPIVQEECLILMCELWSRSLELTRKYSGDINITAAAKLVTGKSSLSRTQAASLIKRCLKDPEELRESILAQYPVVHEAWSEALKTRPTGAGAKTRDKQASS